MEQSIAAVDAAPEQTIRYTLDLTRQYHNLLQKTENNVEQTYFWDGNVTGMEEEGREHFYFQEIWKVRCGLQMKQEEVRKPMDWMNLVMISERQKI